MKSRVRDDMGSATVELVLLTPVLMALALFVLLAGRSGEALRQVQHAADQGARAASQASATKRDDVAHAAADSDLRAVGRSCEDKSIDIEQTRIGRLDAVKVTVSCRIDHVGLQLLGLSGRYVSAESIEVIDVYRAK